MTYTLEDVVLMRGGTLQDLIEEIDDDRKWRAGQPERDRLRAIEEERDRIRKEEWGAELKAQAEAHQRNRQALVLVEAILQRRPIEADRIDIEGIYRALTGESV